MIVQLVGLVQRTHSRRGAHAFFSLQWQLQRACRLCDAHPLARVLVDACRGASEHVRELGRVGGWRRSHVILRVALDVSEHAGAHCERGTHLRGMEWVRRGGSGGGGRCRELEIKREWFWCYSWLLTYRL